jgi:hypothetical protein
MAFDPPRPTWRRSDSLGADNQRVAGGEGTFRPQPSEGEREGPPPGRTRVNLRPDRTRVNLEPDTTRVNLEPGRAGSILKTDAGPQWVPCGMTGHTPHG